MFQDRTDAGNQLAKQLKKYKDDAVVIAIPRGGIEVGHAIAKKLKLPLGAIVVKKIRHPYQSELAMGAAGENDFLLNELADEIVDKQKMIIQAQEAAKASSKLFGKKIPIKGKTVILVDDGIATGVTFQFAVNLIRKQKPKLVIAAIPVAPPNARIEADKVIILQQPDTFQAVGQFYYKFDQVEDEKASRLLYSV